MSGIATQPLLFLGEKRRAAVATRVADSMRRWRQSWVRDADESFDATAEPPATGGFVDSIAGADMSCWALELGAERLAVLLLPHSTFAWVVQGAGAAALETAGHPAAANSLAERLETEVARSLLQEICQLEGRDAFSVARFAPDRLAEWSRAARAWTLHAKSAGSGRGCSVLLSASRVERLAPARTPGGTALGSRREAIGDNSVALRAVVGEASMSVNDLADLALDDVLVLDRHLTEPVTLVSEASGVAIAAGNLGRVGARRAIKVAGISPQEN